MQLRIQDKFCILKVNGVSSIASNNLMDVTFCGVWNYSKGGLSLSKDIF